MHSKYDNMHKNRMFYALMCINVKIHIIACYHITMILIINAISYIFLIQYLTPLESNYLNPKGVFLNTWQND